MESNNINGQSLVKILINYPEGFSGTRHLKEGSEHEMALNSAELLVKKGIATILDVIEEEAKEPQQPLVISSSGQVDAFKNNAPVADLGNVENVEITPVVNTNNTKKSQSEPVAKTAGKKANNSPNKKSN